MAENYVYPAKMTYEASLYRIEFIDFPDMIMVEEETRENAIKSAQASLALQILDYVDNRKELPAPSECNENVVYIHVWLPYFKNITKEIYVKKNVTIPQWLDILAKESKINFSAILVKGIKAELGIDN